MTATELLRSVDPSPAARFVEVAGLRLEMTQAGAGRPILFLHPGIGLRDAEPFITRLAGLGGVLAPAHPGFHRSDLPAGMATVDDIAYVYLDLLQSLDEPAVVIGSSLGGWIALETAVKSTHNIAALVLVDSVGVRFAERDGADFADIYALPRAEIDRRLYHDPGRGRLDYPQMPQSELEILARNREAEARFCWSPYLHSPRLAARLHRIGVPAAVIWGESDGLAPPAYGRQLAARLPRATFETIPAAGHFPHIEQPDALAASIAGFLEGQGFASQKGQAR